MNKRGNRIPYITDIPVMMVSIPLCPSLYRAVYMCNLIPPPPMIETFTSREWNNLGINLWGP